MLAIWSLIPLLFLNPSWASGSSWLIYCWGLENFEHYFGIVWDKCNCAIVWTFFGIASFGDLNENYLFLVLFFLDDNHSNSYFFFFTLQYCIGWVLWPLLCFPNLLTYWVQHFNNISIFLIVAAFTNCSDFGNQENTVSHCFHCFPIYLPWSDVTGCHNLCFSNAESYSSFFTLLFHPHQEALFHFLLIIPPSTYLVVELQDHMIILFSIFWGTAIQFLIAAASLYTPIRSIQVFKFIYILANSCYFFKQ